MIVVPFTPKAEPHLIRKIFSFFSFGQFGLNEYGWNVLSWNGWDPRQMHKKAKLVQDVKDSQIPLNNSFGIYFIIYVQPNFHPSEIVI